jgi:hypothetical protein
MANTNTKANFDFTIQDLEGNEIINIDGPANAGKMLAKIFAGMSKGDIYKIMEWARACYRGETIEFNPKEKKDFQEYIESNEQLTVLSKEQILNVLNGVGMAPGLTAAKEPTNGVQEVKKVK